LGDASMPSGVEPQQFGPLKNSRTGSSAVGKRDRVSLTSWICSTLDFCNVRVYYGREGFIFS
jgi:hypothetical protein